MAGIYVHIPFCRQACTYCDFHFTIYYGRVQELINAICLEIDDKKDYLNSEYLETIYFGGGTPSSLPADKIRLILDRIGRLFTTADDAEITLEANPDDLDSKKLEAYRTMGINRLSIGIQSFRDKDLILMNRRHNAETAISSVALSEQMGFENISIDLIYGLPGLDEEAWTSNLDKAFSLNINHLSAYHLSYEPGTELYHQKYKARIAEISEQLSISQFEILLDRSAEAGFEQYEISSFAKNKAISRHNTAYWTGGKYIGLGPSAHSFNGRERQWNTRGITSYVKKIAENEVYYEKEHLNPVERFNEYLMTSLRTAWGADLKKIRDDFGTGWYGALLVSAQKYINSNVLRVKGHNMSLTDKGKILADAVIRDLFLF